MISPMLSVKDVDASVEFYVQKLGASLGGKLPGPGGKTMLADVYLTDQQIMLMRETPGLVEPGPRGLGVTMHVFLTDDVDIDSLYVDLKARGVHIAQEIRNQYWGERTFGIKDLDGYALEFARQVRPTPPEEPGAPQAESA